jgi:hypothetical protein
MKKYAQKQKIKSNTMILNYIEKYFRKKDFYHLKKSRSINLIRSAFILFKFLIN